MRILEIDFKAYLSSAKLGNGLLESYGTVYLVAEHSAGLVALYYLSVFVAQGDSDRA